MTGLPNSLAARDIASLIHPYTNLEKHKSDGPVIMARGEGVYVYDEAGKRYLEGMAGLWSTSLGFSEKRLVEAARRQMEQGFREGIPARHGSLRQQAADFLSTLGATRLARQDNLKAEAA